MAPSSPYSPFLELTLFIHVSSIVLYACVSAVHVGRVGRLWPRDSRESARTVAQRREESTKAQVSDGVKQESMTLKRHPPSAIALIGA